MKKLFVIFVCLLGAGCSTIQKPSEEEVVWNVIGSIPCFLDPTGIACDVGLIAADTIPDVTQSTDDGEQAPLPEPKNDQVK